jgi:hypothetical protein
MCVFLIPQLPTLFLLCILGETGDFCYACILGALTMQQQIFVKARFTRKVRISEAIDVNLFFLASQKTIVFKLSATEPLTKQMAELTIRLEILRLNFIKK